MKAHCDIETGEIHGCEKYSLKWWHEKGHLVFNSNPDKSWIIMLRSYLFDFWMLFTMSSIVYRFIYPVAVIIWLFYISIGIYEEWWCNQYAKHNFTKEYKI